jgi:hypothetical protein
MEHLAELDKSCKAPVTLLLREAMMCMVICIYARVVRIPEEKSKLDTTTPIFRD